MTEQFFLSLFFFSILHDDDNSSKKYVNILLSVNQGSLFKTAYIFFLSLLLHDNEHVYDARNKNKTGKRFGLRKRKRKVRQIMIE